MRPFEIALVLANLIALAASVRKLPVAGWVGIAGLNGVVLLMHALFEGVRYQMTFSYALVLLPFVIVSFHLTGLSVKYRLRNWLRNSMLWIGLVLLAFTAFIAYAFPVFTLPSPSGEYPVGVRYLELTDEKRVEPFLSSTTQKRRLMVKIYYPAVQDDSVPFLPYFHGSKRLLRAFAEFYQLPAFMFDHFALVKTYTKENLALAEQEADYPIVLFSHGAGTNMEVETSQSEDLASHGYVVVAIDHTYVSSATDFPERVVTAQEATTNFDTPEPAKPVTQMMADDDRFVIDTLGEINQGSLISDFKGKLNLEQIGVMGHSVGGAVAYNLAANDSRVKAAINLDGVVYIMPKNPATMAPFLMLANDKYHLHAIKQRESLMQRFDSTPEGQQMLLAIYGSVENYTAAYTEAQQNITVLADVLKDSGTLYTIEGSDHMKFTDIGLYIGNDWLRKLLQIGGTTEPARCLEITQALTVAFFDFHLKDQTGDRLTSLAALYPELKNVPMP